MSTEYRPGLCNIGPAERRVRYVVGAVSFLIAAGLIVAVLVLSLPRWVLLLTALPLFGGFIGYYQGRAAFCVRFALSGVYNVGADLGDRRPVSAAAAARRDRRRAVSLIARAGGGAIIGAIAVYVIVPV